MRGVIAGGLAGPLGLVHGSVAFTDAGGDGGVGNFRSAQQFQRADALRTHIFAPNSQWRALVTTARRGKGRQKVMAEAEEKAPGEKHAGMKWAKRLKRVCDISG